MTELTSQQWDQFLENYPEAHLLQTSRWGKLKSGFNWNPVYIRSEEAGAQVLFRELPLGFSLAYLPKGPIGQNWEALWPEIDRVCRKRRAIFLQVEPDAMEPADPRLLEAFKGFRPSLGTVQPRRTILIDLRGTEEDWLERMKQKTRYNIRLAERKEIVIRKSENLAAFQHLMEITGDRDGFGVHSQEYYQAAFDLFTPDDSCALMVAEFQEKPLAALMAFQHGKRAWYLFGASSNEERNRMPTYLLQWETMRWAASKGCLEYDLWGVPDAEEADLEAQFSDRSDGLWGVYRFKRGFGGSIVRAAGSWDRVYQPVLYNLYRSWMGRKKESANS